MLLTTMLSATVTSVMITELTAYFWKLPRAKTYWMLSSDSAPTGRKARQERRSAKMASAPLRLETSMKTMGSTKTRVSTPSRA